MLTTVAIIGLVWLLLPLPIAWVLCRSAALEDRAMETFYALQSAETPAVSSPDFPDVIVDIATPAPVAETPVAPRVPATPIRTPANHR
jgi:hypothetical protein